KILILHTKVYLYSFDNILDAPSTVSLRSLPDYRYHRQQLQSRTIHRYFILQVATWVFLAVDTFIYMRKSDFDYFHRPMPEIMTHRMYSPEFWQQGDMLVLTVSSGFVLSGLTFLLQKWLDDRYCMYFVEAPDDGSSVGSGSS